VLLKIVLFSLEQGSIAGTTAWMQRFGASKVERSRMPEPRTGVYINTRWFEYDTYVQDVRYADYAGAKIGNAAIAKKAHF
jgi:hypothetical protein